MYVLDSNIVIYYFRDRGRVVSNFLRASSSTLLLPSVVLYELQTGIKKAGSPRRRVAELNNFLDKVRVIDFDCDAADAASAVRTLLEARGTPIGPIDTLVAGVALSRDATLVTHNVREFARIPDLKIVDWF